MKEPSGEDGGFTPIEASDDGTADEERSPNSRQVVIFRLSDQRFCVDVSDASEIQRDMQLTPVPWTPDFVRGVVNVRGNIKAILDVRTFFGMERSSANGTARFVFVKTGEYEAGLIADTVEGVEAIEEDRIHQPPPTVANVSSRWIDGVSSTKETPLIILDVPEILRSERVREL